MQALLDHFSKIETGELDLVSLMSLEGQLGQDGPQKGALLYRYWLRCNPEHPLRHVAAYNCAVRLHSFGDLITARRFFEQAIEAKPDFMQARLSLAQTLERANDNPGAIGVLNDALKQADKVSPTNIQAKVQGLRNIARIHPDPSEVEKALRQGVELDPFNLELLHHWVNNRQTRCVWPVLQTVGSLSLEEIKRRLLPLCLSMQFDDPALLYQASEIYMEREMRGQLATLGQWPPTSGRPAKLRIAYLSSDFRFHPIGYLMEDIFGFHDRSRYEIIVYNIGDPIIDPLQQKIRAAVDGWIDIRDVPDKKVAVGMLRDRVDILLDINGHTRFQRPRLLAMKPAPIIVNWLGYPGTMGRGPHDYLIADNFTIPPEYEQFYAERVVRLSCYQPNSQVRDMPMPTRTRAQLGLPESGVVFCCFNGPNKITSKVFARWMRILQAVPDSVLWLRNSGGDAPVQLRQEAQRLGVEPARIVVLEFQPHDEYYAVHRYADIFLDTFPYGAHTTASDALRMGVPIVTLPGVGFPSRVCASLCRAAGIEELVCDTPGRYESMAIELARNPEKLRDIKQKLIQALPTSALFDTRRTVRELEELFESMWTAHCAREA